MTTAAPGQATLHESARSQVGVGFLSVSLRKLSLDARVAAGIYFLLFSAYFLTASGHFYSTDHVAVYQTAQSLAEHGNTVIQPMNNAVKGRDGQYHSQYGVGQAIVSIPLYLLGKGVADAGSSGVNDYFSGTNIGMWGGTTPIFFVSLLNQLVTPLIGVLLFYFGLKLGFSRRTATGVALVYGVGTLAWTGAHEYFQHPLETLYLLSAVYVLFANRRTLKPKHTLAAGALMGVGLVTRFNLAIVVPALGLYLLAIRVVAREPSAMTSVPIFLRSGWQYLRSLTIAEALYWACFAAPIGVGLGVVMLIARSQFGNAQDIQSSAVGYGFSLRFIPAGLYGQLMSPGRGFFIYSPPTLLGLWLYRRFFREHALEALLGAGVALTYLVFFSSFRGWQAGWCWGPRYLTAAIPFLVLPIGYAFESRSRLLVLGVLTAIGAAVQILGVTVNVSYVTHTWLDMKLTPPDAYLYIPKISPIPMHLKDLLHNRYVDLWLLFVKERFGAGLFLLTAVVPVSLLASACFLLKSCLWRRTDSSSLRGQQQGEPSTLTGRPVS